MVPRRRSGAHEDAGGDVEEGEQQGEGEGEGMGESVAVSARAILASAVGVVYVTCYLLPLDRVLGLLT